MNNKPIEINKIEEDENAIKGGYSKTEQEIIESTRKIRDDLIKKTLATNPIPKGKEMENLIALLDSQESSAHKTSATRLKVKEEDNNSKISASMIAMLMSNRDRDRQNAKRNGQNSDLTKIVLPAEFEPKVIVDGEMSAIDKKEELDINLFMSEGE